MVRCIGLLLACAFVFAAVVAGCDDQPLTTYFDDEQPAAVPANAATVFDQKTGGSITGTVTWLGDAPRVDPFYAPVSPLSEQPNWPKRLWPNPHAPVIDPKTGGIAGAVVFLRGTLAGHSRPWHHPRVSVAVRDCQYHVLQGDTDARTGFVRRGDRVTIVSEDDRFQAVQARGAAFFTLTLPDRDRPHERVLPQSGVVELRSNAGQFWMSAHLFVSDHPYLARTDAQGRFALNDVPPGNYELACWLPDWHEAAHERDGETALYTRIVFRPSVVKLQDVMLQPGARRIAGFDYCARDFGR